MKTLRLGLVALVAVALAAPTSAFAAASSRCRTSSTTGGAKAFAKSKDAVLFTKRGNEYGCLYRHRHIHQLWDEGGGIHTTGSNRPVLEGRFAAYGTYGSAIGDEYDRILVFDLRTGKVTFETTAIYLDDIVLKKNGSVGWIQASPVRSATEQPLFEVHQYSTVDRQGDVLLARSRTIDTASLALNQNRQQMTWTTGAGHATFAAPLR